MIGVAAESDTLDGLPMMPSHSPTAGHVPSSASPGAQEQASRHWSSELLARVGERMGPDWVAHVPMDGFHLADEQLAASVRSNARARPTRSIPRATPTCSSGCDWKPTRRCTCRASTDTGTTAGRRARRAADRPARGHRGQLPAARPPGVARARQAMDQRVVRDRSRRRCGSNGWWPGTSSSARVPARRRPGSPAPTSATPTWYRRPRRQRTVVIVNSADGWLISP